MASNHLEDLVAEWYEWNGYFVRRNIQVGKRVAGGYECELDVVAFHPGKKSLLQIEPSLDADSWAKREERYTKKFEAGRRYIPALFAGLEIPTQVEQLALFLFAGRQPPSEIAGGRIIPFHAFMGSILEAVRHRPLNNAMIPEQFALLRTLQFAGAVLASECLTTFRECSSDGFRFNRDIGSHMSRIAAGRTNPWLVFLLPFVVFMLVGELRADSAG